MRNHFVPQFLQTPWTVRGTLQVFRLTDGRTFRQAPKGNGYVEDMLSLTREQVAGMDKHAVERAVLQSVDHEASLIRQKLEATQLASITFEERCAWVRFIMSLQIRQPHIVSQLRSKAAETLRTKLAERPAEYEALVDDDVPPTLEAWTELMFPGAIENFGLSFFHKLLNDETVGTKLLHLRWWVWDFAECSNHLLLGDRPCVFAGGIDDPNLAVMLPISPTKAFIATRGDKTALALSEAKSPMLLGKFNNATVKQAFERVFALDETPKRFVENRRSENSRKMWLAKSAVV
jgi:hypothetical protein